MIKKNQCLWISLLVSLVLIVLGGVMLGVFGGFNDDGFTKDKTVIQVTGDPIVTIRESFRNELNDLCKDTLSKEGAAVQSDRYSETTDKGVFEYVIQGAPAAETLDSYVAALEKAIATEKAADSDFTFADTSSISVAYHVQTNREYYKYTWTFAIAAAVVVVLSFVYFAIRFNLGMGATLAIAAVHDLLLACAVIALVRIPTGVGIAAVCAFTLLLSVFMNGYVFGRMRKDFKTDVYKDYSSREAVAASAREGRKPVLVISIVMLAVIVVFGVIGVVCGFDLTSMMLCALVAVLANTYSSLILSPAI